MYSQVIKKRLSNIVSMLGKKQQKQAIITRFYR